MPGTPNIEDRLQRELAAVGEQPDGLIDVVVKFELPSASPTGTRLPVKDLREALAKTMSSRIEDALARASTAVGETPAQVSVFPSLGSVLVQASRPFVKQLIEQNDVRGAVLNSVRRDS